MVIVNSINCNSEIDFKLPFQSSKILKIFAHDKMHFYSQ